MKQDSMQNMAKLLDTNLVLGKYNSCISSHFLDHRQEFGRDDIGLLNEIEARCCKYIKPIMGKTELWQDGKLQVYKTPSSSSISTKTETSFCSVGQNILSKSLFVVCQEPAKPKTNKKKNVILDELFKKSNIQLFQSLRNESASKSDARIPFSRYQPRKCPVIKRDMYRFINLKATFWI